MKSDCISLGMLAAMFAIPFFECLFKIVSGRYIRHEDRDLLILGLVGAIYSSLFGFQIYINIGEMSSPPVISSCIPIVTQENDTLFQFHDSTRYCKSHIEKDEISTTFTITKENAVASLCGTDTCEICGFPLCEHWKSQTVGYIGTNIPAWESLKKQKDDHINNKAMTHPIQLPFKEIVSYLCHIERKAPRKQTTGVILIAMPIPARKSAHTPVKYFVR